MVEKLNTFPKKGDKLIFTGVPEFYYPMFTNIGENARNLMTVGQEYTISKCEVYSSWCCVWLKELPETDDERSMKNGFHLQFFKEV